MNKKSSFHPYAITTIVFWALAFVLTRLALQHFSAFALGFLRYAVASAVLLVVCVAKKMGLPKKQDLLLFVVSGTAGFSLYMIVFNIGAGYVTAATSSFIIASTPVFTALLASLVFRERLAPRQWLGIVIEFSGLLILTLYGAVFSANVGVLWLLAAALLLSCYNLIQRKLTRKYSAIQATSYSIFAGTIMLAVFLPQSIAEVKIAPAKSILYILLLGVFSSAVAYIAWSKAFEKAEQTSQVSNYMFFTPFLTAIMGVVMAGEVPEPSTWIGGAFIIVGALIFSRIAPRNAHRSAETPDSR